MRQGPHHSAQKSATTGMADLTTSASNVLVVTFISSDMEPPPRTMDGSGRPQAMEGRQADQRHLHTPSRRRRASAEFQQCGIQRSSAAFEVLRRFRSFSRKSPMTPHVKSMAAPSDSFDCLVRSL